MSSPSFSPELVRAAAEYGQLGLPIESSTTAERGVIYSFEVPYRRIVMHPDTLAELKWALLLDDVRHEARRIVRAGFMRAFPGLRLP